MKLPRQAIRFRATSFAFTTRRTGCSAARGNSAVQKARIIVPVTRATIVLIEVASCAKALWTRPKPTTSVTQESVSITTLRCVRRLAATSEKLFMTCPPKDVPAISRGEAPEGSRRDVTLRKCRRRDRQP